MTSKTYKQQVELLLRVLPEVAKEVNFALHGGTAINLFTRDMPRLSVDIDLTYIPIEGRSESIEKIKQALEHIKYRIEKVSSNIKIMHKAEVGKLIISDRGIDIKLEVNLVGRGVLGIVNKQVLNEKIAEEYNTFVVMPVIPFGQLYGGKICAALDRQHPRDLFDVKYLLEKEGVTREVLVGFLLAVISNNRPIHEVLKPNFLDQNKAMENQFLGMTADGFDYNDFEQTRLRLVELINKKLRLEDKMFLLSVKSLNPNWNIHKFDNFPAVRWRLQNLERLKKFNPNKHRKLFDVLQEHLDVDFEY